MCGDRSVKVKEKQPVLMRVRKERTIRWSSGLYTMSSRKCYVIGLEKHQLPNLEVFEFCGGTVFVASSLHREERVSFSVSSNLQYLLEQTRLSR